LAYSGLVFGAGFLFGLVRVPWLVPRLGVRTAELCEMPAMLVVIVLAARWVVRRFALPPTAGVRLAVGGGALALVIVAELLVAVALAHQSVGQYVASRDPVSGSAYVALLGVFAFMPLLLARARPRRRL
jgi:hypothetical protein